jgi:hypothetical protein
MMRTSRLRHSRLLLRDWIGDAVLTLIAGAILVTAVLLPWVNEDSRGWVNFSLKRADGFNGVLQTQWGVPALSLAAAVLTLGIVMIVTHPRRYSALLGIAVAGSGIAVFGVARDAAAHIGFLDPGIGLYLTTFVGVLLVPIGLAAALVAWFLARAANTPTAPPAPESAPPS